MYIYRYIHICAYIYMYIFIYLESLESPGCIGVKHLLITWGLRVFLGGFGESISGCQIPSVGSRTLRATISHGSFPMLKSYSSGLVLRILSRTLGLEDGSVGD